MDSYDVTLVGDESVRDHCIARRVPVDHPFGFVRTQDEQRPRPLRFYVWKKVFDVKKPRLFRIEGICAAGKPRYKLIAVSKKNTKWLKTKLRRAVYIDPLPEEARIFP